MVSSTDIAGYLAVLTGIPAPGWAAIVAILSGSLFPWAVEFMVPMSEWGKWQFRALTWAVAILIGTGNALLLWHNPAALVTGLAALLGAVAREIMSHRWPWLSPRQSAIVVKQNAMGETGVKVGDNPTVYIKPSLTGAPPDNGNRTGQSP